jgi:hypothetical protein
MQNLVVLNNTWYHQTFSHVDNYCVCAIIFCWADFQLNQTSTKDIIGPITLFLTACIFSHRPTYCEAARIGTISSAATFLITLTLV